MSPLVPAECDLRDFAFMPLDVQRLLTSETWILGSGDERAAALTLWLASWHQIPAGSLPDNDKMLAHLSLCPKWAKVKAHALRGWLRADDGRLYHPVVCEKALEAWIEKLSNSLSGTAGNAKRWGVDIDLSTIREQFVTAIALLKKLAPQSRALKKKIVASILAGSPPKSPPESPPDSSGDRKGQGQGQGLIDDEGADAHGAVDNQPPPPPPPTNDAEAPKTVGAWARWFDAEQGVAVEQRSPADQGDFRRMAQGWVNARLTVGQMRRAIEKARALSTEGIAWLPGYVDRVLATQSVPPKAAAAPVPAVSSSTYPTPGYAESQAAAAADALTPEQKAREAERAAEIRRQRGLSRDARASP